MKNEILPNPAVLLMTSDLMNAWFRASAKRFALSCLAVRLRFIKMSNQSRFLKIDSWFSLKMSDPRLRTETLLRTLAQRLRA